MLKMCHLLVDAHSMTGTTDINLSREKLRLCKLRGRQIWKSFFEIDHILKLREHFSLGTV